jgi:hypothetical protein
MNDKTLKGLVAISVILGITSALINIVKYLEEKEEARKQSK